MERQRDCLLALLSAAAARFSSAQLQGKAAPQTTHRCHGWLT